MMGWQKQKEKFSDIFPKSRNNAIGFYGGVQFAKSELEELTTKLYENRFEPDKIEILTREYRRKRNGY